MERSGGEGPLRNSDPALTRRRLAVLEAGPDLVGRLADLRGLLQIVEAGTLTTITGVGGVGKTSLAQALMSTTVARFDDQWMCELAAVVDDEALVAAVEAAVGVVRHEDGSAHDAIVSVLRGRRALLVLDNVEQVVGGTARFVLRLLGDCPDLAIVVTSREVLQLAEEQTWTLEPLSESAAIELFGRRATASTADFVPDDHRSVIAEVCASLDRLPLALELAAAQLSSMSIHDLAARLDQRFQVLRDRTRGERQATLGAAVRWSYDRLEPPARRLFDRLSVFQAGFDSHGARSVLEQSDWHLDVGALLESLANRSMLVRSRSVPGRYEMLETLRHYGDRQLAERGERSTTRGAHVDHVIRIVGDASALCLDDGWSRGTAQLALEWDNIRAAIGWAIDTQRTSDVDRLLRDLFFANRWMVEGEPGGWAQRAIERGEATEARPGAPAHLHVAFARFLAGDHAGALAANTEALSRRPTPSDRGWARYYGATELLYMGRTAEAAALADAMVNDIPGRQVERAMQMSSHAVFKLYAQQIRFADAITASERAADMAAETGNPVAIGQVTYNRGLVAYSRGDVDHAKQLFAAALELAREHRIPNLTGYVLVSQVYTPGRSGLAAALDALAYWRHHRDEGNEFVVLEAAAINLAEIGHLEPAAVILGNLDQDRRRIASSRARREAAAGEVAAHRKAPQWQARGAAMTRSELLAFTHEQIDAVLTSR